MIKLKFSEEVGNLQEAMKIAEEQQAKERAEQLSGLVKRATQMIEEALKFKRSLNRQLRDFENKLKAAGLKEEMDEQELLRFIDEWNKPGSELVNRFGKMPNLKELL